MTKDQIRYYQIHLFIKMGDNMKYQSTRKCVDAVLSRVLYSPFVGDPYIGKKPKMCLS